MPGIFDMPAIRSTDRCPAFYQPERIIRFAYPDIGDDILRCFTLLGAFFEYCGASTSFINLAKKTTGKLAGGAALARLWPAACLEW
jgi:TRAP-type uncharacterized transport system fused permease subunit